MPMDSQEKFYSLQCFTEALDYDKLYGAILCFIYSFLFVCLW